MTVQPARRQRRRPLGPAALGVGTVSLALAAVVATVLVLAPGTGPGESVADGNAPRPQQLAAPTPSDDQPAGPPAASPPPAVPHQADGWSHSPQRLAAIDADRPVSEQARAAAVEPPIDAEPAAPVRIVIPAIDVDHPVVAVGLLADGAMAVPDFGLAGWYEPGPMVGEPGPAVIAAHVSSAAGPDVFAGLVDLEPGDEIAVETASGGRHVFVASGSEQQLKEQLPTDRIWSDDDEPVLRLITCGGEFDSAAGSHRDNVIVYAEQAS